MDVLRHRTDAPKPALSREVELPLPTASASPMAVVGACLVFFFLAAMVDALMWQVSVDREQLRQRAEAAEAASVELEWRMSQLVLDGERSCMSHDVDEPSDPDSLDAAPTVGP